MIWRTTILKVSLGRNTLIDYSKRNKNLLVTPHMAGLTYESEKKAFLISAKNIINYFKSGIKNKQVLPTLDKVVREKGYVKGNVQIISFKANNLKSDIDDFAIFKKLYDFLFIYY